MYIMNVQKSDSYKSLVTKKRSKGGDGYENFIISQKTPNLVPDKDFLSRMIPFPKELTYEAFEQVCAINNLKLREYFVDLTKKLSGEHKEGRCTGTLYIYIKFIRIHTVL